MTKINFLLLAGALILAPVTAHTVKNENATATQPTTEWSQPSDQPVTNVLHMQDAPTANALKAVTEVQQTRTSPVPTVHNPMLDATLKKTAETEEDHIFIKEFLSDIYSKNGLYAGSAYTQHETDCRMLLHFLQANTDVLITNDIAPELGKAIQKYQSDFEKSVEPYAKKMFEWMQNVHSPNFYYDMPEGQPTYEEVKKAIDDMVHNDLDLESEDRYKYYHNTKSFRLRQNNPNSEEKMSEHLAFCVAFYDRLIFLREAKKLGMEGEGVFSHALPLRLWMNLADPEWNREQKKH